MKLLQLITVLLVLEYIEFIDGFFNRFFTFEGEVLRSNGLLVAQRFTSVAECILMHIVLLWVKNVVGEHMDKLRVVQL